jgi:hypothetical protein
LWAVAGYCVFAPFAASLVPAFLMPSFPLLA